MAEYQYKQRERTPSGVRVHKYSEGMIESGYGRLERVEEPEETIEACFDPPRPGLEPQAGKTGCTPTWGVDPPRRDTQAVHDEEAFRTVADKRSLPSNVIPLQFVSRTESRIEHAELIIDGKEFDELLVSVERIDPATEALSLAEMGPEYTSTADAASSVLDGLSIEPSVPSAVEAVARLDEQRTVSRSAAGAPSPGAERPGNPPKTSGAIVDLPPGFEPREERQPVRRYVTNPGNMSGTDSSISEVYPAKRELSETMWFMVGDQPRTLARHEAAELELGAIESLNNDYLARRLPNFLRDLYTLG